MELSRRKRRLADRFGKKKQEEDEEEEAAAAARDWPALTEPLLHSILNRLYTVEDIFAFRGVCRSWRSISGPTPPLILLTLSPANALALYDITRRRLYHPKLPWRLQSQYTIGYSHGYLIISSPSPWQKPILWNLLGRAHIRLPRAMAPFRRVILSSPPSSPECLVVLFRTGTAGIQYGRPGDRPWKEYLWHQSGDSGYGQCMIKDMIFFQGRLYCLSYVGLLWVIDLLPRTRVKQLEVEHQEPPSWMASSRDWRLAESGGELLLIHFTFQDADGSDTASSGRLRRIDVYCWDFTWGERRKLTDLGGRALFMGYEGFAASIAPNGLGALGLRGNCIFSIVASKNEWVVFSMEDETIQVVSPSSPGLATGEIWEPPIWVFPTSC